MRLIHQSHNHARLIFILPRQLSPQARKVTRLGPTRSPNDLSIPPRVIMDIDDAMRARLQTRLHQFIVLAKIGLVKSTAEDVINEVLPGDGQAKDVESVVFGKMRHLGGAVVGTVFGKWWDRGGGNAGPLWEAVSQGTSWWNWHGKANAHRYCSQSRIQRYLPPRT